MSHALAISGARVASGGAWTPNGSESGRAAGWSLL